MIIHYHINMDYVIVGYGKMGHAIHQELYIKYPDHNIHILEDIHKIHTLKCDLLNCIAFEFTTPEAGLAVNKILIESGCKVISGSTGWHVNEIENLVNKTQGAFLHSNNFSILMNVLFSIIDIILRVKIFRVEICETHHNEKLDKVSGTAMNIKRIINSIDSSINIDIITNRVAGVYGEHKVVFHTEHEVLSIEHSAYNRKCFASGAVGCVDFIKNRSGFFNFNNLMDIL